MKRNLCILVLLFSLLVLAACGSTANATQPTQPVTLTVFAAASLTDAFTEIGAAFETKNPNVEVVFNFDGSQTLRTQLEQGAAADVFASANQKEMNNAVAAGLIDSEAPQTFLVNNLIVIAPSTNPANLQTLEDLTRPGLKLVLAAEEVPVGNYSRQALTKLNSLYGDSYATSVLANLVSSEDSVKQVVTKVQLGEADAGIVYGSDAVAVPDLVTFEIPAEYNVVAEYPIAPLLTTPNADSAAQFIAYIISPEGQAVLKKWGFTPATS